MRGKGRKEIRGQAAREGKAVALIYAVHDLSRGNVASVSDLFRANSRVPRLLPSFRSPSRRRSLRYFSLPLSFFRLAKRVFGRVALFDLRPSATSSTGRVAAYERQRRGEGEEGNGKRTEGGSEVPPVVYFESLSTVASLPA